MRQGEKSCSFIVCLARAEETSQRRPRHRQNGRKDHHDQDKLQESETFVLILLFLLRRHGLLGIEEISLNCRLGFSPLIQ